jgi:hypothetical protein
MVTKILKWNIETTFIAYYGSEVLSSNGILASFYMAAKLDLTQSPTSAPPPL